MGRNGCLNKNFGARRHHELWGCFHPEHICKYLCGLCLLGLISACSDFFGESAKQPPPAAQVQGPPTSGKVLDARRAGGYTYMELEHNGKTFWIASAVTNVQRNNIVSWKSAYVMKDYKSAALRKEFKEIYFVSSIKIEK